MLFLALIPLCGPCPWPLCLLLPFLQTYARFTGAPLKVHKITNPWRSPAGTQCSGGEEGGVPGEVPPTDRVCCVYVWIGG